MAQKLTSDRVSLRFVPQCGFLDEVTFDGHFAPLHRAPWIDEETEIAAGAAREHQARSEPGMPPMLAGLRGDFFCAPFGASDLLHGEDRPHGASANDWWDAVETTDDSGTWLLRPALSGARLYKQIRLRKGHPVVYQSHRFEGGSGSLPVAHHLMLRPGDPVRLSFSPVRLIATPPDPVEKDPEKGRSLLAYNRQFDRLDDVPLDDGTTADLTVYPALPGHEDLLMLCTATGNDTRMGWSAAVCERQGWVWFGIRDAVMLPSTTLWFSNGGRYYPPFNGSHTGVIGIEECRAFFHLGHRASAAENPLSRAGIPTALQLGPGTQEIRYAFGVVASPPGFGQVDRIVAGNRHLVLHAGSHAIEVPFDTGFFS